MVFTKVLLWKIVRKIFQIMTKSHRHSPAEVVKANTKEAFEFFFSQDDFIAQYYFEPSRLALYEIVAEYYTDMLTSSDVVSVVRIADIGCGTGHMLEALSRKLASKYDIELYGLDFASTAIAKAKALIPTATFAVEDIYENHLPSDFFDLVLSTETLEHLHLPEKALLEILRICKPGGNIIVTVPNGEKDSWDGHVNFWNVAQFSDFLSSYGLIDIKMLQDDTVIMARLVK